LGFGVEDNCCFIQVLGRQQHSTTTNSLTDSKVIFHSFMLLCLFSFLSSEKILSIPTSGYNIIKSPEVEKAMRAVLRENYVRSTERDSAYVDSPQPIGMTHLPTSFLSSHIFLRCSCVCGLLKLVI
jgi:hypothetical protein